MKKLAKKSSQHSLVKQSFAFDLKCRTKKPKLRPRGRPFPKGHTFGNRFAKGQSGNPGGRPSSKKQNEANRAILAEVMPEEELRAHRIPKRLWGRTYAEINAWALEQQGLRGKVGAIAELVDRAEGRPPLSVSVDDANKDPMSTLLIGMEILHEYYGPPAGMPTRKDKQDEDSEAGLAEVAGAS